MGSDQSPESLGILALIGFVVLFVISRKFFPSFSAILLAAGIVVVVLLLLLVGLVIFLAFYRPKEKNGTGDGNNVAAVLQKGRSNLLELRKLGMKVKNQQIRSLTEEICKSADRILHTLNEQPENIPQVRQFLNYYLPTLGQILLKYRRLEESGVPALDMTEKTIFCLQDINTAMEKQYVNLFDDDVLDLSVEMEALTMACKRDGLLADDEAQPQDKKQSITLTL